MTVALPPRPGTRSGRYVAVPPDAPAGTRPPTPSSPTPPSTAPSTPPAPCRSSRPARAGLLIALPVVALLAGLVTGLAIAPVWSFGAPVPTTPAAATAGATVAAAPGLAAAFPDIAALGAACTPYDVGAEGYVTSGGARPLAVVRCDHGAAVAGGWVYYTQWPTAGDARRWHDDQVRWGPTVDGRTRWDAAGQDQGPRHTRAGTDGTVYATAAYSDRPYGFDIVTRSPQDAQRVFGAMRLLPGTAVPA